MTEQCVIRVLRLTQVAGQFQCLRSTSLGLLLPLACAQEALQRGKMRKQFGIGRSTTGDGTTSLFYYSLRYCAGACRKEDMAAKRRHVWRRGRESPACCQRGDAVCDRIGVDGMAPSDGDCGASKA